MISSPCKDCHKKDKPKEECIDNCDMIQGVQRIIIGQGQVVSASLDHSDTLRLKVLVKPNNIKAKVTNILH